MSEQTKPKYGVLVQITSLVVALLMYTTSMTTPALSAIAAAFPDAAPETIKLISSIPSLMLCVFSLVSGWMTTKLSIKKCILIASGLIFIGILPVFFGGIQFVIFTRVVFGAGYGLIFPLASAVVTDLFEGAKKDTMMGWKSAIGALAGVVFQTLGGILTAYSWRFAFLGFLLVIPIVIMVLVFLPDNGVQAKKDGKAEGKFTTTLVICAAVGFLLNTVQFSFMQDMSFVITGDGLGEALDTANVLSTFTAFSFIAGLIYVLFAKLFKKFTPVVAILLVGIAFAVAVQAKTLPVLFVSAAIFGLGFGFTNPSLTLKAAASVTHPSKTPVAISIYVCATGIGQFLSAYVLKFITGTLNMTASRADWQVASIAIIAGCVVGFIALALTGKKQAQA